MAPEATWPPRISRDDGLLHTQIADAVAEAIHQGRFRSGDRLPPERELAGQFGVNRLTVRQALAELQVRRLIHRRTGRTGGTFVADPVIDYDLSTFAGFTEQLRRHGHVAGAKVLRVTCARADATTLEHLQLPDPSDVVEIERLRFADGLAVLLERSRFPADRFGALSDMALDGSLYELLERHFDARPRRALEWVEPVRAGARAARLFGVDAATPLLCVHRIAFDAGGVPVESARDLMRTDRTRPLVWSFEPLAT